MRKLLTFILLILCSLTVKGGGFKISAKLLNADTGKAFLSYYFEDKRYLVGQGVLPVNGLYVFEGENPLPAGIYSIIAPGNSTWADVIVDKNNQVFSFRADVKDIQKTAKISGSEINSAFFDYQRKMTKLVIQQNELDTAKKLARDSSLIDKIDIGLSEIDQKYDELRRLTIEKYKGEFLADILDCMNATSYPGREMWNHVNLAQDGLIRTPFFYKCIRAHIARNIEKSTSVINSECDFLICSADKNLNVQRYISSYLLNFYQTYYKAGMNEVYVHLAENFFLHDSITDLPQENKKAIETQRNIFRSSMIGAKAEDVKLCNTKNADSCRIVSSSAGKMLLLLLWSNGCGHCDSAENSLKVFYPDLVNQNINVVSVCTDTHSFETLKKYADDKNFPWNNYCDSENHSRFREYYYSVSTPQMYIVDNKGTIIRKIFGEADITLTLHALCKK